MKKNQKRKWLSFLITKWDGSPRFEAFRFVVIYAVVGVLWIMFSDNLLRIITSNEEVFVNAQLIKGVFYVLATALLFYTILKRRLQVLKNLNQRIIYHATHDRLTSIPTKEYFGSRFNEKTVNSPSNQAIALVVLDVDNFSDINEMRDYSVGDGLLIAIKDEILSCLSEDELKGRDDGGYVFTITFDKGHIEHVNQILDEILKRMNQTWYIQNNKILITCSIGVALYPKDGKTFKELYRASDIVMHDAKENKKDTYAYFHQDYLIKRHEKINMIHELKQAIEENQLCLVYQPIYHINNHKTIGYEALLRWESKTYGQVSPGVFIPYSENIGMFLKIEEWVFEQSMKTIKQWEVNGEHDMILSVNLSANGLNNIDLITKIIEIQKKYNVNPKQLQIEITETALIQNLERAINHLNQLKAMGYFIALDDFGSGYSSLTYLQRLPIDTVKIDKVFTHRVQEDPKEELVFTSVIELIKKLGFIIIVEGIETKEQHEYIKGLQVEFGQGYYYSYALKESEMMQHMALKVNVIPN